VQRHDQEMGRPRPAATAYWTSIPWPGNYATRDIGVREQPLPCVAAARITTALFPFGTRSVGA